MRHLIFHALRICLGAVFLLSGLLKTRSAEEFAYTVQLVMQSVIQSVFSMLGAHIPFNSSALWNGLAIALILVELSIGAVLLLNRATKYLAAFSALMLTVFTGALFVLMRFGHSCGCFGTSDEAVSGIEFLRNAVLVGCSVMLWIMASPTKQQQSNTTIEQSTDIELSNDVQVLTASAGDLQ